MLDSHNGDRRQDGVIDEELLATVMNSGVDLREYSRGLDEELRSAEDQYIRQFVKESKNITSLHTQIVECDSILERMENLLTTFKSDLGSISSEIKSLQQYSVQMNIKLRNRLSVRAELSQFVNDLTVSEDLIRIILDSPVAEDEFIRQLDVLEAKLRFLNDQSYLHARACDDVKDVLDKLTTKAVNRIHAHIFEKIAQMRRPMANYQMIQNALVHSKRIFAFVVTVNEPVAIEIRDEYVNTVSKVLFSYLKSYSSRLMRLQYGALATKDDLMGHEDVGGQRTSIQNLFPIRIGSVAMKQRPSVFNLGDRANVLLPNQTQPLIIPHSQESIDAKYPYEALFHSLQSAFMENAVREYQFVAEFLALKRSDRPADEECGHIFKQIVTKSATMLLKSVEETVADSYDVICLFICLQLCRQFNLACKKRNFHLLAKYWDSLYNPIWSRFQMVLLMHTQSIRDCQLNKMGIVDQRPHYISRRYAEFAGGMLHVKSLVDSATSKEDAAISGEDCHGKLSDEILDRLMSELRHEVEKFINKAAACMFPVELVDQLLFAINNYDVILTVIAELCSTDSAESATFKTLMSQASTDYVEQVLLKHFSPLVAFVQRAEICTHEEDCSVQALRPELVRLVAKFDDTIRFGLDAVNSEVLSSFPNLHLASDILQQTLARFMEYYGRLYKVVSDLRPQLDLDSQTEQNIQVNIQPPRAVLAEVKKYKPTF